MTLLLALVGVAFSHPFTPPHRPIPAGELDIDLVAADMDGDGLPDMVEWDGADLWIFWNEGELGFTSEWIGSAPSSISSVIANGDLDGDGLNDVAFRSAGTLHVILSAGGWQTLDTGHAIDAGPGAMGDMDGDGDVDLVFGDDGVQLFENALGDGTALVPYLVDGFDPWGLLLADMDADGALDIVAWRGSQGPFDSGQTYIFHNDGTALQWDRVQVASAASQASVGDLDNDGLLDVVVVNSGSSSGTRFAVYRQSAPRLFQLYNSSNSFSDGSSGVTWIGGHRFLTSNAFVSIDPTTGARTFRPHDNRYLHSQIDASGDGAVLATRGGLIARFRDVGGELQSEAWMAGFLSGWPNNHDEHIAQGDVDGDGDLDLAVLTDRNDSAVLMRNLSRDGTAWEAIRMDVGTPESVTLADLTGDGRDEVVVGHAGGITWFEETGGTWVAHEDIVINDDVFRVVPYDFDEDGDMDVLFSRFGGSEPLLEVANNDNGVLVVGGNLDGAVGWYPTRVQVIDLDGDGSLDVVADDMTFRARPGDIWTSAVAFPDDECVMFDLEGDGDADRACVLQDFVQLHTSTGGVLWNSSIVAPAGILASTAIAAGDIDADGIQDLVTASADGISLLHHDGLGGFVAEILSTEATETVIALDLDGDGDDDLLTVSADNGFDVRENLSILREYCDQPGDHDGDGLTGCADSDCAGTAGCPACAPGEDADGDNICDDVDLCFGNELSGDDDLDGICNDSDLCVGVDASGDGDLDGQCDDTDPCPIDPANDSDGDGTCDSVDLCEGDDYSGDADADGLCDDQDFVLTVSDVRRGERMLARVLHAEPFATVEWWASRFGPGTGPCVVGQCGDLDQPVRIARTTADAQGVATLEVTVPNSLPAGQFVFLQSLWRTSVAETSQVVVRRVR